MARLRPMPHRLTWLLTVGLILCSAQPGWSWGFWAHREINRHAVGTLPEPMRAFFERHQAWITAHAVDPDQRRSSDPEEAPRHYLDFEHYGHYPYPDLPRDYAAAVERYTADSLAAYGVVPWVIQQRLAKLTDAMRRRDSRAIQAEAANLGHYVADAHVPLHASINYDGQYSDQRGIHGRWESDLAQRDSAQYNWGVAPAEFIANPLAFSWDFLLDSSVLADDVLRADHRARQGIPADSLSHLSKVGGRVREAFNDRYYDRFRAGMPGMVEARLRASIHDLGSLWYTAWVNAGRPELPTEAEDSDTAR